MSEVFRNIPPKRLYGQKGQFSCFPAALSQFPCHFPAEREGAGYQDFLFFPRRLRAKPQAGNRSHQDHRRREGPLLPGFFRQVLQGPVNAFFPFSVSSAKDGGRRIRFFAGLDQPAANGFHPFQTHQKYQGALQMSQDLPVLFHPVPGMAGDHRKGPGQSPMSHRDAEMFRHPNGRADSRHHLPGDPGLLESQGFFSPPAEDKTVPPFQPYHPFAFPGLPDQQRIDGFLGHAVPSAPFSHRQQFRFRTGFQKGFRGHQGIVEHGLGPGQYPASFLGQKAPSAAGSHQPHFSHCIFSAGHKVPPSGTGRAPAHPFPFPSARPVSRPP